jgi:spore maturation protein CgeB
MGLKKKKVIFVQSGFTGDPYLSIEKSIVTHLRLLVQNITVASPYQDLVTLCREIQPDLILAFNGMNIPLPRLIVLRHQMVSASQKTKLAAWFVDDPYWTDVTGSLAPYYDVIFTIDSSCVPFYQSQGCKEVYFLPLAADLKCFYPKRAEEKYQTDILFIGSAFPNRIEFFHHLTDFFVRHHVLISGLWWDRSPNYSLLRNKILLNNWMSPDETASYYNGAKLVINLHRACNDRRINRNSKNLPANSVNVRTFEISACNTLQLTDHRNDLPLFYTPDRELITYESPQELMEKAQYYLQHEAERQKLASQGFLRTQEAHSYEQRLKRLLNFAFQTEEARDEW